MGVRNVRLVVGVVALGFVLALVLGSAGLLGGSRALGSSTTITIIGGEVAVRHGASASFIAAVDGEVLNAGDAIRTGTDSRAVLTYFEGSTVTIEPNTELSIDAAAAQGSDTVVQMTQTLGRTWHVVTKVVTGDSKYEVRTPASTASVRGTSFEVTTDGTTTTVSTTEGTVVNQIPDPNNPGRTIEVPVPAGQQHAHQRGQGAGGTRNIPEPDRKVTITLGEENTIVIDTLGRANGIDRNGRTVLQTPGATLTKVDGRLVITLPNIPDGRLQALVRKQGGGEVDMQTVVVDRGRSSTSSGRVNADASTGQGRANVDIGGGRDGGGPTVQQTQAPSPSPSPSPSATAQAAQTAAGGGSGGSTGGGGGQGQGGSQGQGGNQGQGGGGGQGQGGPPTRAPGFVPPTLLPTIPTTTTTAAPSPSPTKPGNSDPGGGQGGQGGAGGQGGQGAGTGGGAGGGGTSGGGSGGGQPTRRP